MRIRFGTLLSTALLAALAPQVSAQEVTITGIVRDFRGRLVGDALVQARSGDRPVTVSVYADESGRFTLPLPFAGDLTVGARRADYRPGIRQLTLERGTTERVLFVLERRNEGPEALPSSSFLNALPDGWTKREFLLACAGCHPMDYRMLYQTSGRLKPRAVFLDMFRMLQDLDPFYEDPATGEVFLDWLFQYIPSESRRLDLEAPPLADGTRRAVFTEYDLPDPEDFNHDVFVDRSGQVWSTGFVSNQLYKLDPRTGAITGHRPPVEGETGLQIRAVEEDKDGNLWVLLGLVQKVVRLDPRTGEFGPVYDLPFYPHDIDLDEDGGIWVSDYFSPYPGRAGRLDAETGEFTTYEFPPYIQATLHRPQVYGLRVDPDGRAWVTILAENRLVRIDPEREPVLYELPTAHAGPRRLDVDEDGIVWIPEFTAGQLARFDPKSETFTEFSLPTKDAGPYVCRVNEATGDVWVAGSLANQLYRFNPDEETFATYDLPTPGSYMRYLAFSRNGREVWTVISDYSLATPPKLVRLQVR